MLEQKDFEPPTSEWAAPMMFAARMRLLYVHALITKSVTQTPKILVLYTKTECFYRPFKETIGFFHTRQQQQVLVNENEDDDKDNTIFHIPPRHIWIHKNEIRRRAVTLCV